MKKVLLFITFVVISTSAFAEKVVGSYTMAGIQKDVEATFDNLGDLRVYIEILGAYKNDKVMIEIEGERDLNLFISQLRYCKTKFTEWVKVAKENNITGYQKEFDVVFPKVEIWWIGTKWYSSYKRDFIKPIFLVGDNGEASFGVGGVATDWDNEYIDQKWYLILISPSEFDSLIEALNPDKIKSALIQNANADALFQ